MDNPNLNDLMGLFKNPEAQNTLNSILSSLKNDNQNKNISPQSSGDESKSSTSFNLNNETFSQIQNIVNSDFSNDSRVNLLNALAPYMTGKRSARINDAVKIIKMSKIIGNLGAFDLFK